MCELLGISKLKYTKITLHFYTSIINTSDEKSKPFVKMEVEDSAAFCYDKRKQFGSCAEQGGLKRSGAFSRKLRGVEYYVQ